MIKSAIASICLAGSTAAISAEYIIGSEDFPKSLDYMLDSDLFSSPNNFFDRMASWKMDNQAANVEEEDTIVMYGENFIVHTNSEKQMSPRVEGYQSLNCWLDTGMAKICYGSINDATAWIDFSPSIE